MGRVLIVGGYGTFGERAAARLGRDAKLEIVIAGRRLDEAQRTARDLGKADAAQFSAAAIDATKPDLDAMRAIAPRVVYNASGPFQDQGYALARAAIAVGAHYVDIADARAFVVGITGLDAEARAAGVLIVAGASSVPGLSSAVIEHHLPLFRRLDSIRYGIVPANGFDPGLATTASILSYVGRPFATHQDGRATVVHGWQDLSHFDFTDIGRRRLARCDIPDLVLFPARYPSLRTIDFRAGLEVPLQHFGLWGLSWLVRAGLLRRPERLAAPLLRMKRWMDGFGTDAGGFFAVLDGIGHDGAPLRRTWQAIARDNQGPFIPQAPATILARQMLAGTIEARGATACLGLMCLDDFITEIADLPITIHAR